MHPEPREATCCCGVLRSRESPAPPGGAPGHLGSLALLGLGLISATDDFPPSRLRRGLLLMGQPGVFSD